MFDSRVSDNDDYYSFEKKLINVEKSTISSLIEFGRSDYYFNRYSKEKRFSFSTDLTNEFNYNEDTFRLSSSPPILWVDNNGDIRWNEAAEREMYFYLLNKQTIENESTEDEIIKSCLNRRLFIIEQHNWGFFSRYNCFIEQFGQTLYSPWMTLISYKTYFVGFYFESDDIQGEGILKYIQPISTCSKYSQHPRMKQIEQNLRRSYNNHQMIEHINQLVYDNQYKSSYKYSILDTNNVWSFGYNHIPVRRWMFSYQRFSPTYNLSIESLMNHSSEHIYKSPSLSKEFLSKWTPRNNPLNEVREDLSGKEYKMTWEDKVFTGFVRYMFVLYFHKFSIAIQRMTHLLSKHFINQNKNSLINMAAIHIRRGDKTIEDSFWNKYGRWRNISMYIKPIIQQEQSKNKSFSSIFIMSDDQNILESIKDYANPMSKGQDEPYARKHLQNRLILSNILTPPQSSVDSVKTNDIEQFLVSIQFIIKYAQFIVTHSDSNIARYLQTIIYSQQQLHPNVHSETFIQNAPDSLE